MRASPGTGLHAGRARGPARAGAGSVHTLLPTPLIARQAGRAARERALVSARFPAFAALGIARHVHASTPALTARAGARVAAVQLDVTWMTTGQYAGRDVAG